MTTTFSRRKTLAIIGAGATLAIGAPATAFLATRTPHAALAPWEQAGGHDDPRLQALSFALLAPNPHNRQPWEAELIGTSEVKIWRDKTRALPVTDPYSRQLTIGMGCFLELMDMAAASLSGHGVETTLFPAGEDGPVAHCRFVANAGMADPLFAHTLERRSHKTLFDDRDVKADAAQPLAEYATLFLDGPDRDTVRRIAHEAWWTEVQTPAAWKESMDLLRIGKAEINSRPDGIDVGNGFVDALNQIGLVNREALLDINNPNSRAPIEETADAILSAPASALILTPENSRIAQIEAGRRWLRLNLAATGAGMALRPVSQALQEYSEMRLHYDEIHNTFAKNGETVQMLGILGYGEQNPRTPRWPLETRIRHA